MLLLHFVGIIDNAVMGVVFANNKWIALGQGGGISIATSGDGVSWTGVPNSVSIFDLGLAAMWSSSLKTIIAVGQGPFTSATSVDGIKWSGSVTPFDDMFSLASNETTNHENK